MMKEASKNYISQYKLLFYLSWIVLYFIFPAWRFPQIYISFTNELIDVSYSKKIFGFLAYFFISAYLLNFFLKPIFIDKPLFTHSTNWSKLVKDNLWLILVCCVAAVLHIFSYSLAVGIAAYAVWIYNFITSYWHRLFGFPIQYPIWLFLFILIFILKQKKAVNFLSSCLNSGYSLYKSSNTVKLIFMVFITGIFISYTKLIPYYSFWDHLYITGEPPLGTVLHLIIYLLFGTGNILIAPVVVQFSFYILSGIFLYMTINLFCEKETALLGSSIYLFSPIIFTYATLGHLQSGVVFFIILTSYFFLKFTRDGHNKDLILTAYFISIGSLYKREIILMFVICSVYMIVNKIKQKDLQLIKYLKVLSLPLFSFLPWYFIGTRGADKMVLSHISTLDSVFSALLLIPSQLSWPVFLLFLLSIIFVLFSKRERLFFFFFCVFIAYYVLYSALEQQTVHRYSMAFYPTISVFVAQFIYSISQKIRWRHAFKLASSVLIIYLAVLCIIPRSSTKLITFKYSDFENQSFPFKKAEEWILNKTANDENVLVLIRGGGEINQELKGMHQDKIHFLGVGALLELWPSDDLEAFRETLKEQCKKLKISYIMFPVTDAQIMHPYISIKTKKIMKFLEENRHDEFVLAAKFHMDDNYIYIYKLREEFIDSQ